MALRRLNNAQLFLIKAKRKSLTPSELAQLKNCVRLLKKKSTPQPQNPDNIAALAALFKDFDAWGQNKLKLYLFK